MRYLPRPIGQRMCTWLTDSVNSSHRPLIAPTAPDNNSLAGEDGRELSATHAQTLLGLSVNSTRAPTVTRRSPMEERPRPLP